MNAYQILLGHVQVLATRPCIAPGLAYEDCGWCDSCEARTTLIAVRQMEAKQ